MSWLSGYTYVKKGAVNATTAGGQTNYQLKLIVGESDGAVGAGVHCNRHCQNFPNDIRFTKEDGITKHDYWVESITGTTPNRLVTVIIEVTSIPASGDISFYLYYGAPGASSESSIADTFIREIDGAQPLIGAWNLDNISSDKSGNDNDGTLNGGMGYGTGKIGQAAVFDGIDDHINCGTNNCLNLTTGVTVEAWIKPGDNPSIAPIISKGCLFAAYALNIRNDLLQFQAYHLRYTAYAFTTGVWYHVAGTFGDGYTKIYINGNVEYSKAETGPIGTVAEALFIGWDGDSVAPTPHYKGTVDEGKLYNRALTGDEISDIYGAGGDRYGYATTNYPGRVLICKYASPEPTWGSWGNEEIEYPISVEPPYTAKLGGVSLWIPELSKQNFTITYEENDIPRFSFTLQNCNVNRTAIIDHLADDFVIYRGTTPILTGVIDCDQIEYVSIDQIKVGGFSKWIELGYLIYKRMADADAESADAVFIRDHPSSWTDRTTAAGNDTINDVTVTFNGAGDGIYIGDNDRFNSIKVKYSTKGIQTGTPTFNVQYSKGSDVWATLDCVDESREFTNDPGSYFIFMPTLPPDWSKDTVNSSSKYWIRIVLVTGSYLTEPKLDRIWISQTDVCRVQFDNTAANTIMDLVLADTGYSVDGTDQCPSTIIPSIRGEYDSKIRWVAGIINALKWEDGNGDVQPYAWWIDASKKVHVKQVRGSSYGDITAELAVLGNRLNYFEIANRIFGLGGGTGINQYHAIVENRSVQDTLGEIRETTYNDSRIFDHTLLKGQSGKLLTQSKTAKAQVKCSTPTYNWFDGGYEIGDRIKLHQPKWGIPDETEYAIRRVDISLDTVNFDVGIGREHLDNLQGNIQQQMNIQDVYMQGETSTFQVGPVEANYQRVDATTVYPVKMVIEIPSNATAINKALISWKLGPYHADVTGTGTGGGHLHEPAVPNTGTGGGHAHGSWAGAGGGHTPTELGTGAHKHTTVGGSEPILTTSSQLGYLPLLKDVSSENVHTHTNPTTAANNRGHAHGLPTYTGAYDNDDENVFNSLNTGTACTLGYCITGGGGVDVPSTTHYHHLGGNTDDVTQSHTHTQGATGVGTSHLHTIDSHASTRPYVFDIVLGTDFLQTISAHTHTINTVLDHSDHGIDTLNDFSLTVPDTDTFPDFDLDLQYGMKEIPGGTIMELIVNGVTVGSSYDGDKTDLNIRGYLQNGNNNAILQPAVGQNHKGSAQLDSKVKVFIDTE